MPSSRIYSRLERMKNFIKFFIEKYQPICCFCQGKLSWMSFFPKLSGKNRDEYTIHHKDHNRKNDIPSNKSFCHRDCHRSHHRNEQIWKETHKEKYRYIVHESFNGRIVKQIYRV